MNDDYHSGAMMRGAREVSDFMTMWNRGFAQREAGGVQTPAEVADFRKKYAWGGIGDSVLQAEQKGADAQMLRQARQKMGEMLASGNFSQENALSLAEEFAPVMPQLFQDFEGIMSGKNNMMAAKGEERAWQDSEDWRAAFILGTGNTPGEDQGEKDAAAANDANRANRARVAVIEAGENIFDPVIQQEILAKFGPVIGGQALSDAFAGREGVEKATDANESRLQNDLLLRVVQGYRPQNEAENEELKKVVDLLPAGYVYPIVDGVRQKDPVRASALPGGNFISYADGQPQVFDGEVIDHSQMKDFYNTKTGETRQGFRGSDGNFHSASDPWVENLGFGEGDGVYGGDGVGAAGDFTAAGNVVPGGILTLHSLLANKYPNSLPTDIRDVVNNRIIAPLIQGQEAMNNYYDWAADADSMADILVAAAKNDSERERKKLAQLMAVRVQELLSASKEGGGRNRLVQWLQDQKLENLEGNVLERIEKRAEQWLTGSPKWAESLGKALRKEAKRLRGLGDKEQRRGISAFQGALETELGPSQNGYGALADNLVSGYTSPREVSSGVNAMRLTDYLLSADSNIGSAGIYDFFDKNYEDSLVGVRNKDGESVGVALPGEGDAVYFLPNVGGGHFGPLEKTTISALRAKGWVV